MIADRAILYGLRQHQGWSLIADRDIASCLQLSFLGRAVRDRQHSFLSAAVNDRLHLFLGLAVNDRYRAVMDRQHSVSGDRKCLVFRSSFGSEC